MVRFVFNSKHTDSRKSAAGGAVPPSRYFDTVDVCLELNPKGMAYFGVLPGKPLVNRPRYLLRVFPNHPLKIHPCTNIPFSES